MTGQQETRWHSVTRYVANRQATGTKTDTPLIETPQSISVIPADQIRDQNAQSLNQAVRYTAGVTPETRGAVFTRYDQLTIRGFDADTYWNGLSFDLLYDKGIPRRANLTHSATTVLTNGLSTASPDCTAVAQAWSATAMTIASEADNDTCARHASTASMT